MGRLADLLADAVRSYWMPPLPTRDPALAAMLGYGPTASGSTVDAWTALNYSAWWSAVQLISNSVAALPLFHYRRLPNGGKERFTSSKIYRVIHDEFNPEMTSVKARQTMQAHVLTHGNAYAEIVRDGAGRVSQLWPIAPSRVRPDRDGRGPVFYRVAPENGRGPEQRLEAEEMLHIAGLGFDGICGYSVITKAREAIGLGLATERYGAQFFGNGAVASLIAKHPGKLTEGAQKNLKNSITEAIGGQQKHSVLILEENMTVEKVSISPDDAQFLETRKFSVSEIARWFNMPPHKLGDLERATFSNIEHQSIEYLTDCIRPWLIIWEQELNRKLVSPLERNREFAEHLVDGLLRGDIQSRYNAYAIARQWGWMSADDVRELENMNPLPDDDGKIYLIPMNMIPADRIDDVINAQPQPPPPAPADTPAPDPAPADGRIAKILEDLRGELQRGRLDPEQLTRDVVAGVQDSLPPATPPVDLAPVLDSASRILGAAQVTAAEVREAREDIRAAQADLAGRLEALPAPPEPPPPPAAVDLGPVLKAIEESSRTDSLEPNEQLLQATDQVLTALKATGDDIKAHLVMAEELRRVKRAAVAIVTGTLVRRERDKVKAVGEDPSKAEGLADFYQRRIVDDGTRLLADVADVRAALEAWGRDALVELAGATDGSMAAVLGRWVDRHEQMTNAVMEAINHA